MEQLIALGLVELSGKKLQVTQDHMHLSSTSPILKTNQVLLRTRALERIKREESYTYGLVFSADDQTRKEIQSRFFDFIKDASASIRKAPSREVFQLTLDVIQ